MCTPFQQSFILDNSVAKMEQKTPLPTLYSLVITQISKKSLQDQVFAEI